MEDSAAGSKQIINSLLTEHLKYTPITLIDDIVNTVNELVFRAVTAVEEGLNNTSAESLGFAEKAAAEGRVPERDNNCNTTYPEARAEIENGVHQLETLLESTVDKTFDKLEIYVLRNILTVDKDIAPWMRLPHYENLEFTNTSNAVAPQSLFVLRRKVQETRKLHDALLAEHGQNVATIKKLQSLLKPSTTSPQSSPSLSFLTTTPAAKAIGVDYKQDSTRQPMTTNTDFTVAQLPALRQILDGLRPKLETLDSSALRRDGTSEERRDYIESETRRQLEKNGVDVESGEGMRGPGFTLAGRPRSADEVKALETIADALAGQVERNQPGQDPDAMEE